MRKNKLPIQIRTAVLTICLYSIFFGQSPLGASDAYAIVSSSEEKCCHKEAVIESQDMYFYSAMEQSERKSLDQNAEIVVEKLKTGSVTKTNEYVSFVDTGFTGNYASMRRLYERSRELYYGNMYYGMAYQRNEDGSVTLFLEVVGGNPRDAYREHTEASDAIKMVAESFTGTATEKTSQIFDWVCKNVRYADKNTLDTILSFTETSSMDYNGINASTYTAIMNGRSTCYGTSGLMLALLEMNGISAARVMNSEHAYNAVFYDDKILALDGTNKIKGTITELIECYGTSYLPISVTSGEISKTDSQKNNL